MKTTKKRWFAVENKRGFANTNDVHVFASKKARDQFVENNDSADAIYAREATLYAANWNMNRNEYDRPKPFAGEYWAINTSYCEYFDLEDYIGSLSVESDYFERLYK